MLICGTASAQPAPDDAPAPSVDTASITGTVTLGAPGAAPKPAAHATVALDGGSGPRQLETDAGGRFVADRLPAGTYAITVISATGEQSDARLTLAAGQAATLTIPLVATAASETIEVRGLSVANQRRESADTVTVVETEQARRQTADLGDLLTRTQGVEVQRGGGLGSSARLSLGGLTDEQIRFFFDGVPLELTGYPFGIANVPVNLVDRIEVYSGVVPVRFGADALGGAVNLVTDPAIGGSHAGVSYQLGSFGTHRVTGSARYLDHATGLFARADGFFDHATNNYPVDVEVDSTDGKQRPATVDQFHDRYLAGGGSLEAGVIDRPWARRLAVRLFGGGFHQQYQSNEAMNRVYGAVTYAERTAGGSVRYEQDFGGGLGLDAVAGYAYTGGHFRDRSTCVFDWFGACFLENQPGEITEGQPHDQFSAEHGVFLRANAKWKIAPGHELRLAVAPTYDTRSGHDDQTPEGSLDPVSGQRELTTVVSGVEYQLDVLGDRLENIVFAKHYYQRLAAQQPTASGLLDADRETQDGGFGDGLRLRLRDGIYGKLSYERAVRLPRGVEVFGDNAFVVTNLQLAPETSHNVNLSLTADRLRTPAGELSATATGFFRAIDDLIVLLGNDSSEGYSNVFGARVYGVEGSAAWLSPGAYLALDGNVTYQDLRNTSSGGEFGVYEGARVPNRPYLFGTGNARFQLRDVVRARDELSLRFNTRYVHEFFRTWENAGLPSSKQLIRSQLVHTVGIGYVTRAGDLTISTAFEISNLTDERVFDFFGQQRPGRAFYWKTTVDY